MNQPPGQGRDNTIRRTARVLEIIQLIATQPHRWSRRALAEHCEIGERMIQKDLEIIRYRLGLPLRHKDGAYYFERLPQLPTSTFVFSEALALLVAARAAQAIPGINSAELAAAIARLESLFPDEFRYLVRDALEQLPRRAMKAHRQEMLTLLHRAMAERRQVRIRYATASRDGQPTERVVEPYHIMAYGRSWHMIAYDHRRQEVLQFKVDRVLEAEILETAYTIPADFDVDAYLGDAWGLMRGAAGEPETGRRFEFGEPDRGLVYAADPGNADADARAIFGIGHPFDRFATGDDLPQALRRQQGPPDFLDRRVDRDRSLAAQRAIQRHR